MTTSRGRILVGTSGWVYPSWRGDFYPRGLRQREELAYLTSRTTATEVNASFYRLQRPSSYRTWRDQTPDEHVFAVKGSRYVTHIKRLREPVAALGNLLASGVLELGPKLGVMLWQLPATQPFDEPLLRDFLDVLPATREQAAALAAAHDDRLAEDRTSTDPGSTPLVWRHALEPRHDSFADDRAAALLAEHGVAMVWADSARRWPELVRDTADFRYVRLHGHTELYASRYADRTLDAWAERCRAWAEAGQDVHVYFDNDARGHAPHDAVRLLERLSDLVPEASTGVRSEDSDLDDHARAPAPDQAVST